ncbi:uncharacterized protein LOC124271280 isoform X2 [Haliotis rubra]|uniref:uncharacterized protein LOC124271280 isoform X2 n=1 Tax=Haliotis rubra TaxID=36100 RepID=UPI001EE4EF93|nr:uncharacterized protein LOC124271280 isoform X2 [Haliotis rubra]
MFLSSSKKTTCQKKIPRCLKLNHPTVNKASNTLRHYNIQINTNFEDESTVQVLKLLETTIKIVSKSKKALPDLITRMDVKGADFSSRRNEAPRLVLINGTNTSAYIVGDNIQMKVYASDEIEKQTIQEMIDSCRLGLSRKKIDKSQRIEA